MSILKLITVFNKQQKIPEIRSVNSVKLSVTGFPEEAIFSLDGQNILVCDVPGLWADVIRQGDIQVTDGGLLSFTPGLLWFTEKADSTHWIIVGIFHSNSKRKTVFSECMELMAQLVS